MSWFGWRAFDDFDDDGLTEFEKAQVRAALASIQEYENLTRRYHDLLFWLAKRIVPGQVDRRLTKNPFAFASLTPDEWNRFFQEALQNVHLSQGLAPISPDVRRLEEENRRLWEQLAVLEARYNELKADRDRLQDAVIQQRRTPLPEEEPQEEDDEPDPVLSLVVPSEPPARYAALFSGEDRPKARYRELIALAILAVAGYSSEASLRREVVRYCRHHASPKDLKEGRVVKSPDAGSIKRLFKKLAENRLIERLVISIGQNRIVIIVLTELGRNVVREMNFDIVESEWERLMRLHGGERQQKHAAQVCLFTHYARKRGWTTQVCPEVQPPADPDVLIEKDGERIYVEVEAGSGTPERRMKKWRNQRNLQGFAAICAPNESIRKMLVREARSNTKQGMATDFMWLREDDHGLWAETW